MMNHAKRCCQAYKMYTVHDSYSSAATKDRVELGGKDRAVLNSMLTNGNERKYCCL